MIRCIDS